jgi:hypothetical protein
MQEGQKGLHCFQIHEVLTGQIQDYVPEFCRLMGKSRQKVYFWGDFGAWSHASQQPIGEINDEINKGNHIVSTYKCNSPSTTLTECEGDMGTTAIDFTEDCRTTLLTLAQGLFELL